MSDAVESDPTPERMYHLEIEMSEGIRDMIGVAAMETMEDEIEFIRQSIRLRVGLLQAVREAGGGRSEFTCNNEEGNRISIVTFQDGQLRDAVVRVLSGGDE